MKIVFMVLLLFVFCGCGTEEAAYVSGGAALSHTLAGAKADIAAKKERLLIESAAVSEIEKEAYTRKIEMLTEIEKGVEIGEQALTTDWSNPESVGGIVGTVLAGALAWFYRKKGIESSTKYKAHKEGAERFMRSHPRELSTELYDSIGEAKAKNSI